MQIVQNFRTWWHGISPTTGSNNFLTDSTSHLISSLWNGRSLDTKICINMHQYASMMIPTWKPLNTYCHCASNCQHLRANLSLCQAPASNLLIPFGCYTFALQPWQEDPWVWYLPGPEIESILKIHQNLTACSIMFIHASHQNGFLAFSRQIFSTIFIHIHEMVSI